MPQLVVQLVPVTAVSGLLPGEGSREAIGAIVSRSLPHINIVFKLFLHSIPIKRNRHYPR